MEKIIEMLLSSLSGFVLNEKTKKIEEKYETRRENKKLLVELIKEFPTTEEFNEIEFRTEFEDELEISIDQKSYIYQWTDDNFTAIENTLKRDKQWCEEFKRLYEKNHKKVFKDSEEIMKKIYTY